MCVYTHIFFYLLLLFIYLFLLNCAAIELDPCLGFEPASPAVEVLSLNDCQGTAIYIFFIIIYHRILNIFLCALL